MKQNKKLIFSTFLGIVIVISMILILPYIPSEEIAIDVWAESGHHSDIQSAVDIVASMGGGNVGIPAGEWNFCEIGETWTGVNVPESVSIFGAPTQKDYNNQVIEWKTVLIMPYQAPEWSTFFTIEVIEDYNEPFRFSDIKLIGWRYFDYLENGTPNWKLPVDQSDLGDRGVEELYTGIALGAYDYGTDYQTDGIDNFRVDHCHFQDITHSAIFLTAGHTQYNRHTFNGVIDHNILVNSYGDPGAVGVGCDQSLSTYELRTLGYGIAMRKFHCDVWESDTSLIAGEYNDYTVIVENNYFSKWRHCYCANDGFHVIARYNTVEADYGSGSFDGHGSYATSDVPYAVGTRLQEIYGNTFKNPDTTWTYKPNAINVRGGGALIYDNTIIAYDSLVFINDEYAGYTYPEVFKCAVDDIYIWDNILNGAKTIGYNWHGVLNENYFLRAPSTTLDGWEYTAYPYPSHLIFGENLVEYGTVNLKSKLNDADYEIDVTILFPNGDNVTYTTPKTVSLEPGTYTIISTTDYGTKTAIIEITGLQITTLTFDWLDGTSTPDIETNSLIFNEYTIIAIAMISIIIFLFYRRKKD